LPNANNGKEIAKDVTYQGWTVGELMKLICKPYCINTAKPILKHF